MLARPTGFTIATLVLACVAASGCHSEAHCRAQRASLRTWTAQLLSEQTGIQVSPREEDPLVVVDVLSDPGPDNAPSGARSESDVFASFTITRELVADLEVVIKGEQILGLGPTNDDSAPPAAQVARSLRENKVRLARIAEVRGERLVLGAITLTLSQSTRWSLVVDVLHLIRAEGFTKVRLVFAHKPKLAVPPRTWVDREQEQTFAEYADQPDLVAVLTNSSLLRKQIPRAFADCPDFSRAFQESLEDGTPVAFPEADVAGAVDAAQDACDCEPDWAALRSILWRLHRPNTGTIVDVRLADAAEPESATALALGSAPGSASVPASVSASAAAAGTATASAIAIATATASATVTATAPKSQAIVLPANTPWSEAHKPIVAAARQTPPPALIVAAKP